MTVQMDEIMQNNKFNIVDVLLMDHRYLKECIKYLKNDDEDKKVKLKYAKTFLDALHKHSEAEKKAVYAPCLKVKDLKMEILEGQVEHGITDAKVKMLIPKLTGLRTLSDELEVELKVLAELVEHHLKEEEEKTFPKMKRDLDKTILNEMGFQFMKLRSFTVKDLRDYPKLQKEVSGIRKLGHRISGNFIAKVQKHVTPAAHR
ncbi:hemerythrin domain-containing protein [Bacteriovorax sp. PP10]|uniref:Hemerythrin domain-containing protein n=1 Tax=Bacteriovorax antarcticus TaxID=3088717 RepID=A0ABU5VVT2_9BACT|nr:hemerythrin domain-containing protein [Bacteriovorax sp. PP10]MEA9355740.1 hemerythrin domain-containing protein [Bacteriovorax sp. PP10]